MRGALAGMGVIARAPCAAPAGAEGSAAVFRSSPLDWSLLSESLLDGLPVCAQTRVEETKSKRRDAPRRRSIKHPRANVRHYNAARKARTTNLSANQGSANGLWLGSS